MAHNDLRRIALVTGANKGIGQAIARQLAEAGMTVLVGARDEAKGEAVAAALREAGHRAEAIVIDLLRPETLHAAAWWIGRNHARLDVLVNNAGITDPRDGAPEKASIEAVERVFATNFFGTLRVTQAMVPWLARSGAARIVNVSCGLGSLARNGDTDAALSGAKLIGYNASKAALNMMTVQLAHTLRESAIAVNSVDPGYTATEMHGRREGGHQSADEAARSVVSVIVGMHGNPALTGGFFGREGAMPW